MSGAFLKKKKNLINTFFLQILILQIYWYSITMNNKFHPQGIFLLDTITREAKNQFQILNNNWIELSGQVHKFLQRTGYKNNL